MSNSAQIFRFVVHDRLKAYADLGWEYRRALEGTHHGLTAFLVEWVGDGPPVEPEREEMTLAG